MLDPANGRTLLTSPIDPGQAGQWPRPKYGVSGGIAAPGGWDGEKPMVVAAGVRELYITTSPLHARFIMWRSPL